MTTTSHTWPLTVLTMLPLLTAPAATASPARGRQQLCRTWRPIPVSA
jgi:hypothetical protein